MMLRVRLASPPAMFFAACVSAAVMGSAAWADLIVYDGFNYTVGGTLESNDPPWIGLNSGTAPVIAAGNLTVPDLAPPTGNRVTWVSGNIKEASLLLSGTQTSGTVYYSFPFQLSSVPTSTTYSFGFTQNSSTYGATIWLRADGADGFNIAVGNRTSTPATGDYLATKFPLNDTIFVVGSYEFVPGTGNDVSRLWVNPSSATFAAETAPPPTLTGTGGTDLSGIQGFLLRGASGSPAGTMDELRIGTSWAAVTPVPEPSGMLLAGLGGLLAAGYAVRRRK
jgi:hypothetical protein